MEYLPDINISGFDYPLPENRIAQFPLPERDESRLLIYKDGKIEADIFKNISEYIPGNCLVIRNETKVIQARILFRKETGSVIELFCLEPVLPIKEMQLAFGQKSCVVWKCLVGNSKRWKSGKLMKILKDGDRVYRLMAERTEQCSGHSFIRFEWEPSDLTFSEILLLAGLTPLPPYVKREPMASDTERYQTIYAQAEGSVAAPTAGLHFTDLVSQKLMNKNVSFEEVILHVSAGTFKPITSLQIKDHRMHDEKIAIHRKTISKILEKLGDPILAVGTTTIRTIETLYWHGVKLLRDNKLSSRIEIGQWIPYDPVYNCQITVKESLETVLKCMDFYSLEILSGQTQLMIVPGYTFRIPNILVTNFHMPKSTLLMLVSAFIGDNWKQVYNYALNHEFRFLSYGDACLFFKRT